MLIFRNKNISKYILKIYGYEHFSLSLYLSIFLLFYYEYKLYRKKNRYQKIECSHASSNADATVVIYICTYIFVLFVIVCTWQKINKRALLKKSYEADDMEVYGIIKIYFAMS